MTSNLVNYWRQKEDARHNLESENLGYAQLAETRRHNIATEAVARDNLALQQQQLAAQVAYNQGILSIQRGSLAETIRTNIARETETARHNVVAESLESQRIKIQQEQTDLTRDRLTFDQSKWDTEVRFRVVDTVLDTVDTIGEFTRDTSSAYKNYVSGTKDLVNFIVSIAGAAG